ncbi:DNA-binding transcriptional ArsR family regulator [Bacillus mesophilus]|uniref:Winged helix-turn-helix transcriptional regulator n=1 Tax=Bacillus mesophilus TaxID=1808955 RepID=A0A6M0Q5Z6_9BACI|nr:winged helix-turn-helix domain-containing protein [Bacillus mesophilus]MBM7661321.1 DNA-binding transcriptional ArsR family regulator [Bacillus mesophilus]NEY71159.1 winged helix-turn-helix transcriptional regulator [Bacillus mesophilus]
MAYRVEFEFSPLYELANSLDLFLNRKSMKHVELGQEWIINAEQSLELSGLSIGNTKELPCLSYLFLLIWQSPEKEEVQPFIKWLHSLQPGSIYEKLFPYISAPLPTDLLTIRDQYIELIKVWDTIYFSKLNPDITDALRESVLVKEKLYYEDPISYVEQISGGLRIEAYEGLEQVIMIPTYHTNPLIVSRKLKNTVQILYPIDLPEGEHAPPKKLVRLTKALADENRLKILKLVYKNPMTFTEILQYFDVSKSTVHHHVMLLRTAGLISAYHTGECCSETFVYRPTGMDELTTVFMGFMEN